MKTFLWTSLFWIVVAIAWLLCLGFWNLWTQVVENSRLSSIMPNNLQEKFCEPLLTSTLDWIDWCAAAESKNCYPVVEEVASNTDDSQIQSTLADIIANQEIIYGQLQESFIATQQMINDLSTTVQSSQQGNGYNVIQVIDEREIQRQQLQAQIEELQNQMANLY